MILRLLREPTIDGATLGSLYVNGHWRAWTLEDAIREQHGVPVSTWKVPAQTAIPSGSYRVVITQSVRFKRPLPLLVDVPGFSGVRIHPGNTIADTEGCILVGRDRQPGRVLQSRVAFEALFGEIAAATEGVWMDIDNPRGADTVRA
jgi:hypothetical protein